jgi:hypothetical protein
MQDTGQANIKMACGPYSELQPCWLNGTLGEPTIIPNIVSHMTNEPSTATKRNIWETPLTPIASSDVRRKKAAKRNILQRYNVTGDATATKTKTASF